MVLAQPFNFYLQVAQDMHDVDDCVAVKDYLAVISKSSVWQYDWGLILADGNQVHMHILKDYRKRVFLRKPFREVTTALFKIYPVIYTQILKKPKLLEFELQTGWKIKKIGEKLIDLEMKKEDFKYA